MTDLPLIEKKLVDGYLQVTDESAIQTTRRLAKEEGIFAVFYPGQMWLPPCNYLKQPARENDCCIVE